MSLAVEVKSRASVVRPIRFGRSPFGSPHGAGYALGHRCARKRSENSMPRKLAAELLEAAENRGPRSKREETHRMAEANSAPSHTAGKS